jgi:hypothetical protein
MAAGARTLPPCQRLSNVRHSSSTPDAGLGQSPTSRRLPARCWMHSSKEVESRTSSTLRSKPSNGSKRDLEYQTVDAFLDGARALDLATIYGVTISGTFPHGPTLVDDQSAYVRFEPQPGLAVHIHVQAPAAYEEFVIAVADQINHLVERGERPLPEIERGVQALSVACSLGAIFLLALTHRTAWTITGLALTVGGVLVLLARRALHWLFPPFELLPEGGFTRLRTIWNRARGAAVSTARPVYAAFLGAVLVLLLRRLIF